MCYRDNVPALDFDGIHVACLCGDNGSGKSSIFDAITWALWGKTSRGKNDDLLSSGQNEMQVEYEFYNGANRYRIIRKYTRSSGSKSGQVMLDLQVHSEGQLRSLSEHTSTSTQEKIIRLLHLDYHTFINSAMLQQGKSNEFSIKIPSERKDILARILDLSFYDELEEEARRQVEKNKVENSELEKTVAAMDSRIGERPLHEQSLDKLQQELHALGQNIQGAEDNLQALLQQKETLTAASEQIKLIKKQLDARNNEIHSLEERLAGAVANLERFNKIIPEKDFIEKGHALYKELSAQEEVFNRSFRKFHDLSDRKNRLEKLITAAQNAINSERKVALSRLTELENRCASQQQLQQQKVQAVQKHEEHSSTEADIENKRNMIKDLSSMISSISTVNSQIISSVEEIRRKMAMISHAGAVCPLCERELGPDEHQRIETKLAAELQQNIGNSRDNTQKLSQYKSELIKLEKEIRDRETAFKAERDKTRQQLTLIDREIAEIDKAAAEITLLKPRLEQLDLNLRDRNFAADEQKVLTSIENEIIDLKYNENEHLQISVLKNENAKYDQLFRELNEAQLHIASEEKFTMEAHASLERLRKEAASLICDRDVLMQKLSILPDILKQLEAANQKKAALLGTDRDIRDRVARLKENIRQIDAIIEERKEKSSLMKQTKEAESIYTELARYFGKKGIQALIIEESLPEITNETNLLLGKMTDNRMSVSLETQKETKKGDTLETLDIKVADELGTRSYEMYSGGEAFRIDLALRIAISRLLVRRSGASMPILIIDEGFGTQDTSGLEKLIEAINSIQDDFEKIFIITHLEELRDRFPAIINITKTGEGSTISVTQ